MASYQHLRQVGAAERDHAIALMDELLPDDPVGRAALVAAQRDVVGRGDAQFQVNVLVGALSRVVHAQQQKLDALVEAQQAQPKSRAKKAS